MPCVESFEQNLPLLRIQSVVSTRKLMSLLSGKYLAQTIWGNFILSLTQYNIVSTLLETERRQWLRFTTEVRDNRQCHCNELNNCENTSTISSVQRQLIGIVKAITNTYTLLECSLKIIIIMTSFEFLK